MHYFHHWRRNWHKWWAVYHLGWIISQAFMIICNLVYIMNKLAHILCPHWTLSVDCVVTVNIIQFSTITVLPSQAYSAFSVTCMSVTYVSFFPCMIAHQLIMSTLCAVIISRCHWGSCHANRDLALYPWFTRYCQPLQWHTNNKQHTGFGKS